MSGNRKPYVDYTIPVVPGDSAAVCIPMRDAQTVAQRTVDGVLTHHGKWWNYPEAKGYDDLFRDAKGDRRNGDGTLRRHISPFEFAMMHTTAPIMAEVPVFRRHIIR